MNQSERKKLIELLIKQFQELSDPQTKLWFDNYLKGAIEYRGLKTPQVTSLVKQWHSTNQLALYTSSRNVESSNITLHLRLYYLCDRRHLPSKTQSSKPMNIANFFIHK